MMSIFSPRSSRMIDCTRMPFIPTHAPTGSTSLSRDTTAIFVRSPASRAMARISTVLSYISGTSLWNRFCTNSFAARETTTWSARIAVNAQQHHTHPLAHGKLLQPRLFAFRHPRFRFANIEDHILPLDPLNGGVQHFAYAMRILVKYRIPLGLAHLLKDDLFGHLRSNAAQHVRRLVVAQFAAYFHLGSNTARLFQVDLV